MDELNLLTLTAVEAQEHLRAGSITSVELVQAYLTQIGKHNHNGMQLNALISVAPESQILEIATTIDEERKAGKPRGPLHGIPFIIKDVFVTYHELGMPTTAGGACFASAKAKRTAPLIQHLLDAGMILLGKANLTEFCGMKQKGNTPGWSPAGGQTQSPYIFGGLEKDDRMLPHSAIGGSSSGTASGVAAGFAPLGIGTECVGSVITPANRAALYSLKVGHAAGVSNEGVFAYTDCVDCVGGMAKSADDVNLFTAAIMQKAEPFDSTGGFEGLRVGFLDPKIWRLPDEGDMVGWTEDTRQQMEAGFTLAIDKIRQAGGQVEVVGDLLSGWEVFKFDSGKSPFYEIASYQMPNVFLPRFIDEFSESEVRSIENIIAYNEKHADICLPPDHPKQDEYHELVASPRTAQETSEWIAAMQNRAWSNLDPQFAKFDVLVAFAESPLCIYSSASAVTFVLITKPGLPIATVPLGMLRYSATNSRPYGLAVVGKSEQILLRFMKAHEEHFPPRPLPKPLL